MQYTSVAHLDASDRQNLCQIEKGQLPSFDRKYRRCRLCAFYHVDCIRDPKTTRPSDGVVNPPPPAPRVPFGAGPPEFGTSRFTEYKPLYLAEPAPPVAGGNRDVQDSVIGIDNGSADVEAPGVGADPVPVSETADPADLPSIDPDLHSRDTRTSSTDSGGSDLSAILAANIAARANARQSPSSAPYLPPGAGVGNSVLPDELIAPALSARKSSIPSSMSGPSSPAPALTSSQSQPRSVTSPPTSESRR